uniref:Beta-defensin n=1 Tax=Panagrolaimus davidi TaxID=227884 RepID=A0A914QTE6_9BILA
MFKVSNFLFVCILSFAMIEAKLDWWGVDVMWYICVRIFEGYANQWCHTAYLNYTQCHATALYCCTDDSIVCSKSKLEYCCMPP